MEYLSKLRMHKPLDPGYLFTSERIHLALWDKGLETGHLVRSVEDWFRIRSTVQL